MKNKRIIFSICMFCVIVLVLLAVVMNSTGVRKYNSEVLQNEIDVPLFSFCFTERQGDDTVQIEFYMIGSETQIVTQVDKLYNTHNDDGDGLDSFDFMQWSVNDNKLYKHIVIVYEKV